MSEPIHLPVAMSEPIYSPVTMGPIDGVVPGDSREMGPPGVWRGLRCRVSLDTCDGVEKSVDEAARSRSVRVALQLAANSNSMPSTIQPHAGGWVVSVAPAMTVPRGVVYGEAFDPRIGGMICVCNAFSLKAKGVGVDSGNCRCCCCGNGGPAGLSYSPGRFRLQCRNPLRRRVYLRPRTNLPSVLRI